MKRLLWLLPIMWLSCPPEINAQLRQPVSALSLFQAPVAASPASSTLRFDGLYHLSDAGSGQRWNYYLRFHESGNVDYVSTNASPGFVAANWYLMKTSGPNFWGRYKLAGDQIEIVDGTDREYKGAVGSGKIALRGYMAGGWPNGDYEFAALEFVEVAPPKSEHEPEPASSAEKPAAQDLPVTVVLGQAAMGEGCKEVTLTPAAEPIEFPAGTTELAYQVTLDPSAYEMDVAVRMSVGCESTERRSRRCNQYAIVGGRPINSQWTTIVRCGDGKPFLAGSYKLELLLSGVPVKEVSFTVQ